MPESSKKELVNKKNKSTLARASNISRSSLYYVSKKEKLGVTLSHLVFLKNSAENQEPKFLVQGKRPQRTNSALPKEEKPPGAIVIRAVERTVATEVEPAASGLEA